MLARDVMTKPVITIGVEATVRELADLLVKSGVSAVPVIDQAGKLAGIVSEGDIFQRAEIGTARSAPWWLRLLSSSKTAAVDFVKSNARQIRDVMTREVISVSPETPLSEIAKTLEKNDIKRVPIVSNGQIVGIVSRANLVRAFATHEHRVALEIERSDDAIREQIDDRLAVEPWMRGIIVNCLVEGGVADLWGIVPDETVRTAVRVAAESAPGVKAVNDHLIVRRYESAA